MQYLHTESVPYSSIFVQHCTYIQVHWLPTVPPYLYLTTPSQVISTKTVRYFTMCQWLMVHVSVTRVCGSRVCACLCACVCAQTSDQLTQSQKTPNAHYGHSLNFQQPLQQRLTVRVHSAWRDCTLQYYFATRLDKLGPLEKNGWKSSDVPSPISALLPQ